MYNKQNDNTIFYDDQGLNFSKENNSSIGKILNLEIKGIYFEEVKNDL